ncbi:hypothetical protein HAX54_017881 [Datura stramonium]|uniref:Uncharacterized protein n=1 Tax=Datura stramonium TaxID=4076 RepID=A0ABS8UMM0_DATST|nr:hypothetical protein [Datura stramonium]
MNDVELEEMWQIQRDALDKEESRDPVKDDDDDDDEQPSTERDKTPGDQDILSNEGEESVPENQLDMNSPANLPDEGPDLEQMIQYSSEVSGPPQIGLTDPSLLSTSGPSQPLNSDTEVVPEKSPLETSYDYLFEGDLPVEKGTSSNILAHGDQLIIQSLTQMDLGGERSPRSEITLSRSPSSVPKSPVLSSTPKWDGTPGFLDLQRNAENEDDVSDDDQPLIWKVKKLAVRSHQKESGDQVRPPVTRSSSRRLIEDALKDNQQKMTQRKKLKRKMIVEEDVPVQLENVLDLEEGEKEPEDIVLSTVKRGKRTSPPTSRNRSTVTKWFPIKRIASSSRRRPGNALAEDVPAKSITSIRTKRNPLSTDRPSEGPGTYSASKVLTKAER